jgi:hypothetical protein
MNVKDLIGTFTIVGSRCRREIVIKGHFLAIDTNNRIIAKWLINEQEQIGTGFSEMLFLL